MLNYIILTRQVDCHISFFLDWTLQLRGCSSTTTTYTKSQFLQHHILLSRLIHQLLFLRAQFEHFRNSVSTKTKKCKLTIVNEHALTIFHTNFPLTHFLFHYLFYSVLISVASCPSVSVSCFLGCLKKSCRIFRHLVTIILVWSFFIHIRAPCIFDVADGYHTIDF
jgi:hypothetical protein